MATTGRRTRTAIQHPPAQRLRQRSMALAILSAVIVADQAMKWWAWRHFASARINAGGDVLAGSTVGSWFSEPLQGGLLDLLDFGLLTLAVLLLVRRRHAVSILLAGSLMVGGWSSNLLDRVVMHYWTAPGSVRGVVDYIHIPPHYYNVADLFIVGATPLFLVAIVAQYLRRWVLKRLDITRPVTPTTHLSMPTRARTSLVAAALGLMAVVGMGAANYGGTTAPATPSASAK